MARVPPVSRVEPARPDDRRRGKRLLRVCARATAPQAIENDVSQLQQELEVESRKLVGTALRKAAGRAC